jgi:hypothetical protein
MNGVGDENFEEKPSSQDFLVLSWVGRVFVPLERYDFVELGCC